MPTLVFLPLSLPVVSRIAVATAAAAAPTIPTVAAVPIPALPPAAAALVCPIPVVATWPWKDAVTLI